MTVLSDKRRRSSKELFDAPVLIGTYSDTEWRKIKTSLASVRVELDETMIDLELPDVGQALERPLRDALQGLAWYYSAVSRLGEPLTPKQQAAELRKGLTTLKVALDAIGSDADTMRPADALVARVQQRHDELAVMGSRSHNNARKTHIKYWRQLTLLWRTIPANNRRRRHKDLHQFLLACSAPVFPTATTDKALIAFIERDFLQTK
jgi:hypothetical protein